VAWLLVAASLLLNGAVVSRGVHLAHDSAAYVASAQALAEGDVSAGRPGGWFVLKSAIALSEALTGGFIGLLVFQILVAGLACFAVYDLARRLGGVRAGVFASVLLVADLDVARFHAYVLTDSLYTSLVAISVWAIYWAERRGMPWRYVVAFAVTGVAAALRPNGWLLPVVALGCWNLAAFRRRPWVVGPLAVLVLGVALAVLAPTIRQIVNFEDPGGYVRRGEVVADLHAWFVAMPAEPGDGSLLAYILRHPAQTFILAFARIAVELAHVRPVYSLTHNVLITLVVLAVYPLAASAFWQFRRERLTQLIAATVVTQLLIVSVTGADWDGRYLLFVFPLILLLAGCGLVKLQASISGRVPALQGIAGRSAFSRHD
jgi:4-amino-4-deoxy-L-arabinose transferase-like glycosyltransferase